MFCNIVIKMMVEFAGLILFAGKLEKKPMQYSQGNFSSIHASQFLGLHQILCQSADTKIPIIELISRNSSSAELIQGHGAQAHHCVRNRVKFFCFLLALFFGLPPWTQSFFSFLGAP
jgi:hypothetical protein